MTKPYTTIRHLFEFVGISLDRNYRGVNKFIICFVFGLYFNILNTERILQFWVEKFSTWKVTPAQEVNSV